MSEEEVNDVLGALTSPGGGNEVASIDGKLTDAYMITQLPFLQTYREEHAASTRLEGNKDRHESRERAVWLSNPNILLNNRAMADRKIADRNRLAQIKEVKARALADKPRLDAEAAAARQLKSDQQAVKKIEKREEKRAKGEQKLVKQQQQRESQDAKEMEKQRKLAAKAEAQEADRLAK